MNGVFKKADGTLAMLHCPKCHKENYCMNVLSGICSSCGYDANGKESNEKHSDPTKGIGESPK